MEWWLCVGQSQDQLAKGLLLDVTIVGEDLVEHVAVTFLQVVVQS